MYPSRFLAHWPGTGKLPEIPSILENPTLLKSHQNWTLPVRSCVRTWGDGGSIRSKCHGRFQRSSDLVKATVEYGLRTTPEPAWLGHGSRADGPGALF